MTAVAQSAMLRDEIDAALAWADRALALADEFDLPRGPPGRAGGEGLGAHRPPAARRRGPGDPGRPGRRGREGGRVGAGRPRAEQPGPGRAADLAGRARRDAGTDAGRRRAGRLRVARGRRLLPGPGPARDARGRPAPPRSRRWRRAADRDRGYLRRGRWADYHGVFLAGLYLEAGELDRVERAHRRAGGAARQLRPRPSPASRSTSPAAAATSPRAEAALDELFAALAEQTLAQRSTGPRPDLRRAGRRPAARTGSTGWPPTLLDADVWDAYRTLVDAQLAEARGQHAEALAGYLCSRRVHSPAAGRSAAPRTSARPAACSPPTGAEAATEHVEAAATLLAEWRGWRVAQLDQVRASSGWPRPTRRGGHRRRPR